MERTIDLRSDTITLPSREMLNTVLTARLGDSLRNEDETVRTLEKKAAEIFGKEEGLLLISGTMANQVALAAQAGRGKIVFSPEVSHIARKERVSTSLISGCAVVGFGDERGFPRPGEIEDLILRCRDVFGGEAALVTLENTVNASGGLILPTEVIRETADAARKHGLPLHLDGSRIFNALVETGEDPKTLGDACTTLCFCLSKGLGAPLGSVLVGPRDVIERAREWRNLLGGGMRQAGVFAAPGLYALENNVERLRDDHEKAREFARIISSSPRVKLLNDPVETNIVLFSPVDYPVDKLWKKTKDRGVLLDFRRAPIIRAVTHLNVSREEVREAAGAIISILDE